MPHTVSPHLDVSTEWAESSELQINLKLLTHNRDIVKQFKGADNFAQNDSHNAHGADDAFYRNYLQYFNIHPLL